MDESVGVRFDCQRTDYDDDVLSIVLEEETHTHAHAHAHARA